MAATWSLILFFLHCDCSKLLNHVTLVPTNPNQQGAFVAILDSYDVATTATSWNIVMRDQISLQMLIHLSPMWAFHPTYITKLRLTINSSMKVSSVRDCDLYIAWTDIANTQFFTTVFRMDKNENIKQNRMSPICDTATPPTNSMNYANINDLVMNDAGNLELSTKATNGGLNSDMEPPQHPSYPERWPITIQLENDPINNVIYITHYNPTWGAFKQKCGFSNTFPSSQGLQIYIGGDDIGEEYNFTSFTIELETNDTSLTTNNPTDRVTDIPTNNPSHSETSNPTFAPTKIPTNNTSQTPTNNPTKTPTNNPSKLPPNNPTNNASKSPSKTATNSATKTLSTATSTNLSIAISTTMRQSAVPDDTDEAAHSTLFKLIPFGDTTIIISFVLLGIVTVCVVFCLVYNAKRKKYMNRVQHQESLNRARHRESLSNRVRHRESSEAIQEGVIRETSYVLPLKNRRFDVSAEIISDSDDRMAQNSIGLLQQQIIKMARVDMNDLDTNSEICSMQTECSENNETKTNLTSVAMVSPFCLGGFSVVSVPSNSSTPPHNAYRHKKE